jgi:hypothetical protein
MNKLKTLCITFISRFVQKKWVILVPISLSNIVNVK